MAKTKAISPAKNAKAQPGSVDFDELLAYPGYLIRRAHSRIQTELEPDLANTGIATGAFGLLTLIRANPSITAMDLAAASSLDKSTLSPMIVGLEKMGLIRREARASDRRFQSLFFVDAAEPEFGSFRSRIREFEKRVAARLTKSEQTQLAGLLMKLQGLGEITVSRPPAKTTANKPCGATNNNRSNRQ